MAARMIDKALLVNDKARKEQFHACRKSIFMIKQLLEELAGCPSQEVHKFFRIRDRDGDVVGPSDAGLGLVANGHPLVPPVGASDDSIASVLPVRPMLKYMNRRTRRILERNDPLEADKMYREEHEMQVQKEKIAKKRDVTKKQRDH